MSLSEYLEGLAFFLPTLAGALLGAALLVSRRFPQLTGAVRVVAFAQLAILGVLATHLAPMLVGALERWTVLLATALWVGAAFATPAAEGPPAGERPAPPDDRRAVAVTVLGAALLTAYFVAVADARLTVPPVGVDALSFHLPTIGSWIQEGTLWQIPVFLPQVSPGHYPNNGDVLLLATILPWNSDFLAHLALYPVWVLTGVAVYALARTIDAPRSAAAMAGLLVLAIPSVAVPALVAELVDIVMLFGLAVGLLFLVRHHRSGSTAELVLAGLALGVSFGTKWYGVSTVAVVIAVWAVASLLAGRRLVPVLGSGVALVGLVAASGGIWLLRNLVESGNPVHPVKVELFGVTIFDAPPDTVREEGGWTILHYVGDTDAWMDYILPQWRDALSLPSLLVLVAMLVAGGIALVRRRRGERTAGQGLVLAGAASALLIMAVYSITPYTAGGPEGEPVLVAADSRYVVPALLIAAALAAWAAARVRHGLLAFTALGVLGIVHGVSLTSGGERSSAYISRGDWATGVAAVAALALVWWAAPRVRPMLSGARGRLAAAGALAAALVAVVAGGHVVQDRFHEDRFVGADPTIDWLIQQAPSGARVGLAGLWDEQGLSPIWPAFGPAIGNDVAYLGELDNDTLFRYPSASAFETAVREGGFDLLIIGRGRAGVATPPEQEWARRAGFELVAASQRLALFRVPDGGQAQGAQPLSEQ